MNMPANILRARIHGIITGARRRALDIGNRLAAQRSLSTCLALAICWSLTLRFFFFFETSGNSKDRLVDEESFDGVPRRRSIRSSIRKSRRRRHFLLRRPWLTSHQARATNQGS